MRKMLGLSLAGLLLCAGAASAAIINVPGDQATIHAGVQAANAGDTVLVAAGTYTDCTHETEGGGSTTACVIMKTGVTLIGAGMDDTIIDVQGLGRGIFVELVSDVRIENLQVRNAFAEVYGGGILLRQVDNTVEMSDLKIQANTDGGIICINSAGPIMRRIEFLNNGAKQGGGLAIEETSDAQCYDSNFYGNYSPSGGAIIIRADSNAIIDGCTFSGNYTDAAFGNGGAIAIISASPTLSNLDIQSNDTQGYGGGVAFMSGSGGSLTNSVIANNTASYIYGLGGGIHTDGSNPTFEFLQIFGNDASGVWAEGGGINVNYGPAPTIRNCTIVDNHVGDNGMGGGITFQWSGDAIVEKCIIAQNEGLGLYCNSASPSISCSDVWGNTGSDALCGVDLGDNFALDPQFCVPIGFREVAPLAIASSSPCMPGNHPNGAEACDGEVIGADQNGCGTSVDGLAPGLARLVGNAPNPFNPKTTIFFVLDEPGIASIRIYDIAGRGLATILTDDLAAGRHQVEWDGRGDGGEVMASGVYLYTLDALGETHSRRMILVK